MPTLSWTILRMLKWKIQLKLIFSTDFAILYFICARYSFWKPFLILFEEAFLPKKALKFLIIPRDCTSFIDSLAIHDELNFMEGVFISANAPRTKLPLMSKQLAIFIFLTWGKARQIRKIAWAWNSIAWAFTYSRDRKFVALFFIEIIAKCDGILKKFKCSCLNHLFLHQLPWKNN